MSRRDSGDPDERNHYITKARVTLFVSMVSAIALGVGGGHAAPPLEGQSATSRWFQLGPGSAVRTFTMRRAYGIVRLARITTTSGIRASVEATAGQLLAVSLSNDPQHDDPARECRSRGDLETCTVAQEGCPSLPALWRVRLEKRGGPAGLVRFDFVVG